MAGSAPDYAVDALDRALQARDSAAVETRPRRGAARGAPGGRPSSELAEGSAPEALTLPSLNFKFKAPSFLGTRSRWVLFILLVGVAVLALVLAWDMVKTAARDAGGEWVVPPTFTLVVAALALAFAFAAVMGFGEVDLSTSIGEGTAEAGKEPAKKPAGAGAGLAIRGTVPPDDATGIGVDVQVEATFSEAIDPGTLSSATFVLRRVGSRAPVPASVALDADTTTGRLIPTAPLLAGTSYEVEISKAVRARSGAALAAARTWDFTTAA